MSNFLSKYKSVYDVFLDNWGYQNHFVAYLLLMVGLYALFFEIYSPGLILPGVVGGICLLFAMYAFQLLPVNYVGVTLILLGCGLFILETVVTSFGVLALGGLVSLAIGSVLLFDKGVPGFHLPITVILMVIGLGILIFISIFYLLFSSRSRPVVTGVEAMIGMTGTVVLNEQGVWLQCQGELWRIENTMSFEAGESCQIVKVKGLSVVVNKLT